MIAEAIEKIKDKCLRAVITINGLLSVEGTNLKVKAVRDIPDDLKGFTGNCYEGGNLLPRHFF
jgi:hypothetical protein